ncbi:type II toxin-antitoxin system RelE/ParE family toxin [Novilysobacter defluvii]|uniref:type II toxin-antitoxin system RelE/ParE family toxin n=1 Tax=Novilysobacter defluvii TaxID=391738 RepID=UPI00047DB9C4|nr:type II toxin-antitoxin system RelE/ParE family toxin [Lysobacter defluvii]
MAVAWSKRAADERERLFLELGTKNPQAADRQDDALSRLVSSLDGVATYQQLPDGTYYVPVQRYPIVVLYDRDPATGDVLVLDVAPARSNWKP